MARTITQPKGRWLQVRSGAVYHWSEALAKAPGAFIVGPQVAADYFRKLGVDNALTQEYPPEDEQLEFEDAPDEAPPAAVINPVKSARKAAAKRASKKPPAPAADNPPAGGMVMSDKPATPDQIQAMIDGVSPGG